MKNPLFTIDVFTTNSNNNINTYYFDLLQDSTFGIHKNEKLIFSSPNAKDCVYKLKLLGFDISETVNSKFFPL